MQTKIMEYFQRRVKIFTSEKPAWVWMLSLIGAIILLAAVVYGMLRYDYHPGRGDGFLVAFVGLIFLYCSPFSCMFSFRITNSF